MEILDNILGKIKRQWTNWTYLQQYDKGLVSLKNELLQINKKLTI